MVHSPFYIGAVMKTELSIVVTPRALKYDAACRMIAEIYTVDEVKDFHDKVAAVQEYARQSANYDLEKQAFEVRKRAERRAGELLKEMERDKTRSKGRRKKRITAGNSFTQQKTLDDLGITPRQSHDWQKYADVPAEIFDEAIAKAVAGKRPDSNVVNMTTKKTKTPTQTMKPTTSKETTRSILIWEAFIGRRAGEGLVDSSPAAFLGDTLDDYWKKRLKKDIAVAREWLNKVEEFVA